MGPLYFLFIAIITPAGDLEVSTIPVQNCDGKAEFQQLMQEQVDAGTIKDWNAQCLTVGDKGHSI